MTVSNTYQDPRRARAYASIGFPATYHLAFRDLPELLRRHARGTRALNFGCGAGRSTRFLRDLGFQVVGVDVSADMLVHARATDPAGDYREVGDGDLRGVEDAAFDVVLAAFPFDNVPTEARKVRIFAELRRKVTAGGVLVNLVSAPELYVHEWTSFTTADFPENRGARNGEVVHIVIRDVEDARPVDDVLWTDEAYREVYRRAGLELVETHRPLGRDDEGFHWINETRVPPWAIYVLRAAA